MDSKAGLFSDVCGTRPNVRAVLSPRSSYLCLVSAAVRKSYGDAHNLTDAESAPDILAASVVVDGVDQNVVPADVAVEHVLVKQRLLRLLSASKPFSHRTVVFGV